MARKGATAANVQSAIDGPDFEAALAIINGRVANAKQAQSKASGDASQAWGSIEKLGVNKRGAQMFARVQGIEDEDERQDQLRTFMKLCELEGIGISIDMVDMAQGKTSTPAPVKAADPVIPPAPAGDTDLADGAEQGVTEKLEEQKATDSKVTKIDAARKRAVAHLNPGQSPDATD